jgi:hypothetical protein
MGFVSYFVQQVLEFTPLDYLIMIKIKIKKVNLIHSIKSLSLGLLNSESDPFKSYCTAIV